MKKETILFYLFVILVFSPSYIWCQKSHYDCISTLFKKDKNDNYKGQYMKGAQNGMGIQKIKSNEIYIGDFVKNKKHGFGMLLVSEESKIKELPETSIYVGRWQDDKKDRSGRCYN